MKMKKSIFLYVTGEDFAAVLFERNFTKEAVYEEMVKEGVTHKVYENEYDYYIEVTIYEFDEVDEKFEEFIKQEFIQSDDGKQTNFYRIQ